MAPTQDQPPILHLTEAPLDDVDPNYVKAVQAFHHLVKEAMTKWGFIKSKIHIMAETRIVLVFDILRASAFEDSMLHVRELRREIEKDIYEKVLILSLKIRELYIRSDLYDISMAIVTLIDGRKLYFALPVVGKKS